MVGLRWLSCLCLSIFLLQVSCQTDDLVGFFVSEAYDVYTQVTSAIGSVASAANAAAASSLDAAASSASEADASGLASTRASTTDDSDSATSTGLTSTPTSQPSDSASDDFPTSTLRVSSTSAISGSGSGSDSFSSSGATAAAAAETQGSDSASASSNGNGGGNNNLPIILGCVLGALALGLLILALLLCCKRRRRRSRKDSLSSRALSPESAEVESWRRPSGVYDSRHGSNKELMGAPLMSEHPAFRNHSQHENPFVPVPPPPRRAAPNSRAGLTDGAVAGDDPYLMEKGTGQPLSRPPYESSHKGRNLALGAGAVAAGALAMHHHDKKKHESFDKDSPYTQPPERAITRKPIPSTGTLDKEPLMTSSPVAMDNAFVPVKTNGRQSIESARSRPSRDAVRANAAFDTEYAPLPTTTDHPYNNRSTAKTAAALGAGALAGAAVLHHRDSRSRSTSATRNHSPHANVLLASQKDSDHSNPTSDISTSSASKDYSDAVPLQVPSKDPAATIQNPADIPSPSALPAVPATRSRRNSALGTAAPIGAIGAYMADDHPSRDRSIDSNHDRSRSNSRPSSYPNPGPFPEYRPRGRNSLPHPQESNQPLLPSRSQAHRSFPSPGARSTYHPSTNPNLPLSSSVHSAMNPEIPAVSTPGLHNLHLTSGIVGDNRYPHMGVPRRRSGGEYDYAQDGSFLPATVPLPQGMHEGSANADRSRSRERKNSMSANVRPPLPALTSGGSSSNSGIGSDDSAYRLSSGMPGGWARNAPARNGNGVRKSMESARSPVSPITDGGYHGSGRDSFLSGSTAVTGGGNRRVKLADLRREEEDMLRRSGHMGRGGMESEWGDGSGYDGYGAGYGNGYEAANRYYDGVGLAR
jgi:hypothetical protein